MRTIGVLGCGKVARKHVEALKKFDDTEIIVGDVNQQLAEEVAAEEDIRLEEDHRRLIESPEIGIVDVCTPVTTHKEIIIDAIQNDKHVFCEKPLCLTLNEAYEIKGAAEATKRNVTVGYLYRFHPAIRQIKNLLDENVLGDIHFGHFRLGARGSHRAWKHRKESGGGVMNEIAVHKLDLICWLLGSPEHTRKHLHEVVLDEREIDDEMVKADAEDVLLAEFQVDGAKVLCQTDLFTPGYMEYIELMGSNGSIFTSILDFFPTVIHLNEARGDYEEGRNLVDHDYVNLFEHEFEDFFTAIDQGRKSLNSLDDSIRILELVEKF